MLQKATDDATSPADTRISTIAACGLPSIFHSPAPPQADLESKKYEGQNDLSFGKPQDDSIRSIDS